MSFVSRIFAGLSVLLTLISCGGLGLEGAGVNLSLVLTIPGRAPLSTTARELGGPLSRAVLSPDTTWLTVSYDHVSLPEKVRKSFVVDPQSQSIEVNLANVPLGTVTFEVVAGTGIPDSGVPFSQGQSTKTLVRGSNIITLTLLPLEYTTLETPLTNSAELSGSEFSGGGVHGIKIAPTGGPGLYRFLVGSDGADGPLPFVSIHDQEGRALDIGLPQILDDFTHLYGVELPSGSDHLWAVVETWDTLDPVYIFYDHGVLGDVQSASLAHDTEFEARDAVLVTFDFPMDTGVLPTLNGYNSNPVYVTVAPTMAWINETTLRLVPDEGEGWKTGELAFTFSGLQARDYQQSLSMGTLFDQEWPVKTSWQSVYVDPVNGNDANTGLTALTPLKTVNAALEDNVDALLKVNDAFSEPGGAYKRILVAATPNNASVSATLPGTQYLKYEANINGGFKFLGGRDPSNQWAPIQGAMSYIPFTGQDTRSATTLYNLVLFSDTLGHGFTLDNLYIRREDQVGPSSPSAVNIYILVQGYDNPGTFTITDSVLDAGSLTYSRTGVSGARSEVLQVGGAQLVLLRNTFRNRASQVTGSGSTLYTYGINFGGDSGSGSSTTDEILIAHNAIDMGGITSGTATGGLQAALFTGNSHAGSVTSQARVHILNNTIRLAQNTATLTAMQRNALHLTSNAASEYYISNNNIFIEPVASGTIDSQAFIYHSSAILPAQFKDMRANHFSLNTTSTDAFASKVTIPSSSGFMTDGATNVIQTLSALNTLYGVQEDNTTIPDVIETSALQSLGYDTYDVDLAYGFFAFNENATTVHTLGGVDLMAYYMGIIGVSYYPSIVDFTSYLTTDRLGVQRTGDGSLGWSRGAYEKD